MVGVGCGRTTGIKSEMSDETDSRQGLSLKINRSEVTSQSVSIRTSRFALSEPVCVTVKLQPKENSMPPPKEIIEKALECLGNTTVNSFTASPTNVRPGVASMLKWKVTTPDGCSVKLSLNGSPVSATGSRNVEPSTTTTYKLIGTMSTVQGTLGTVTVSVDTSQCFIQSVDEETVRQMLRSLIEANLADSPLSQRSPATVEIDKNGIAVRLRLKIAVPNFFDPDLNVDMVIRVMAVNHNVVVSFRSYSNDVDWPWWVTGITLGISKFIEETIEDKIEQQVKPQILQQLKEQIDSFLQLIPATHRLYSLTTESNAIRGMVCRVS
jgi:hypothetical protein